LADCSLVSTTPSALTAVKPRKMAVRGGEERDCFWCDGKNVLQLLIASGC